MKALTVRQPWAWAIAEGAKRVENRSRRTTYRGPLAIHAGAAWDKAGAADARALSAVRHWRHVDQQDAEMIDPAALPLFTFRAVIAVVDLVDCHSAVNVCCQHHWGDQGTWHWVLANPRKLEQPVPASGRLGLWDVELVNGPAVRTSNGG